MAIDIEQEAAKPAAVSNDEGSVRERTIKELIEADQYNQSQEAGAQSPPFGTYNARLKPGGSVS